MRKQAAQSGAPGPVFEPVIFTYEGHVIQAINDNFTVWLVAADIAEISGYSTANYLIKAVDDDESGTHTVSTLDGPVTLMTVSVSGCCHAIWSDQKPNGRLLRRWITDTVVPETRRTGKDARMTTHDTLSEGNPSGRLKSTRVDQAHLLVDPTDDTRGVIEEFMQDFMRLDPRRRQRPVQHHNRRHYPAVDDLIGATAPGRINKTLWLEEYLKILTDNCQTLETMRHEWHQDPAFTDRTHPMREIVDTSMVEIDLAIETMTRLKRRWEEALKQSKPIDPEPPASKP